MSDIVPARMQAPQDSSSATIDGHSYTIDEKGQVKVAVQAHVETLRRHGFTDVVESPESAKDILAMDREALVEYIEERGGSIDGEPKIKKLKVQALNAGGFKKEAEKFSAGKA